MVTRLASTLLLVLVAALVPFAPDARADGPAPPPEAKVASSVEPPPAVVRRPRLYHAPVTVAEAHRHILIYADILEPDLLARAIVVYRPAGAAPRAVELRRSSKDAGYVAEIPASDVRAPSIAYTIELELTDGSRVSAFATRSAMHRVEVAVDYLDLRETALAKRLSGRRSVVALESEYVSFGTSPATVSVPGRGLVTRDVGDHFYRVEGAYTYRPLRFVTEFSVRMGVLRGSSPVPLGTAGGNAGVFDVGLDYIAPSVRLRFGDAVHADFEFLTGLTEERFRVGARSELLLGDPYGSKLVLGVQGIDGFGARFWSRVDLPANDRIVVSPIIEATNWPHADAYGVRLLLELGVDLGAGFGAVVGGGYQARQATSGGPSGTLSLRYAF